MASFVEGNFASPAYDTPEADANRGYCENTTGPCASEEAHDREERHEDGFDDEGAVNPSIYRAS
jgi:hypothetical protein